MSYDLDKARRIDDLLEEGEIEEDATAYAFDTLVSNLSSVDFGLDAGPVEKTFAALQEVEELQERLDDIEEENAALRETVDRLGDIGEEKTSKEQKIAAIVTYGDRQRSDGQSRVTVLPKAIVGATGCSRRYAYDLIDDMVDEYEWALDPQERDLHVEQDTPQRGVLVDFDVLHTNPEAVNKFTTGTGAVGVAD